MVVCYTVFSDWTGVVCDEDDVVCKIARNMSKPVDWQDPPPGMYPICSLFIGPDQSLLKFNFFKKVLTDWKGKTKKKHVEKCCLCLLC